MALPVLEPFTAANNASLPAAIANWTTVTGAGAMGVNTNACYTQAASESAAYWNVDTPANDQYAEATVTAFTANANVGVGVRAATGANSYYGFYWSGTGQFFKSVAGVWTQFGSDITMGIDVGDVFRIEVVGTTVRAKRNGVQVASATDSALTAGRVAVVGWNDATGDTNARIDDFEGGEVGVGLTVPTLVGAGTAAFTATSSAAIVPTLPSGWAEDDIHLIAYAKSNNDDLATLSGWTRVAPGVVTTGEIAAENNTAAQRFELMWRRAVAGDSDPSLPGAANTVVRGAQIFGIRGCPTTGDPFTGYSRINNAASATVTFPATDAADDDTLGLAIYAYEDDPTAATTPTNWAAPAIVTSALGNGMALGYTTRSLTAAGNVPSVTCTVSGGTFANSVNVGVVLLLRPGPAPAATLSIPPSLIRPVWTYRTRRVYR